MTGTASKVEYPRGGQVKHGSGWNARFRTLGQTANSCLNRQGSLPRLQNNKQGYRSHNSIAAASELPNRLRQHSAITLPHFLARQALFANLLKARDIFTAARACCLSSAPQISASAFFAPEEDPCSATQNPTAHPRGPAPGAHPQARTVAYGHCPLSIGRHVDHMVTHWVVERCRLRTVYYSDLPY